MKALIIFAVFFTTNHIKVRYCTIEIKKCLTNQLDTLKVKAYGGVCLAQIDSVWCLTDLKNNVFEDSVCDYRILKIEK